MKKYAMIPINYKYDDEGKIHIRRVLISYKGKPKEDLYYGYPTLFFSKTKFIEKDSYFYDDTNSHKYVFEDDGYMLQDCANSEAKAEYDQHPEIYEKRKYHVTLVGLTREQLDMTLFEAATEEDAIRYFKEREELN